MGEIDETTTLAEYAHMLKAEGITEISVTYTAGQWRVHLEKPEEGVRGDGRGATLLAAIQMAMP